MVACGSSESRADVVFPPQVGRHQRARGSEGGVPLRGRRKHPVAVAAVQPSLGSAVRVRGRQGHTAPVDDQHSGDRQSARRVHRRHGPAAGKVCRCAPGRQNASHLLAVDKVLVQRTQRLDAAVLLARLEDAPARQRVPAASVSRRRPDVGALFLHDQGTPRAVGTGRSHAASAPLPRLAAVC